LLIILGGFFAWCIGVAANFKQGWRESVYHNLFSVACFASVLFGFFLQGITFPLWGFLLTAGPLSLIKIDMRTKVVEAIRIGLSIAAIFYLWTGVAVSSSSLLICLRPSCFLPAPPPGK